MQKIKEIQAIEINSDFQKLGESSDSYKKRMEKLHAKKIELCKKNKWLVK